MPAIPTHLTRRGEVDEPAQEQTCLRLVEAGVDGLLLLGTTGEGMALDEQRRRAVVRVARSVTDGSISLVTGCSGNSTTAALQAVEIAAEAGSDAVLVPPPFYYLLPEEAIVDFYSELAQRSPLPIVLYHIPKLTKNRLSAAALQRLATLPEVVGLKDSEGELSLHLDLIELQGPTFCLFQGVAPLLYASYSLGWGGAMSPVAALMPELELGLRETVEAGDEDRAHELGRAITEVASLFRYRGLPLVTNVKAAFEAQGYGERWTEPPIPVATDDHVAALREMLATLRRVRETVETGPKGGSGS